MKDEERTPLRVVLRNFLNHIENLESQVSPDKSYDIEFQSLKVFSENVKGLKEYSCLEGEKEINRKKNRYKDILPFDVSRVVLQEYNGIPGSDYINANYIKGASGSPAYIASQGPLPCTVNDFWRMVVQCEVHVIVMACNQEEAGKAKCEKYWVDEGEERHFGRISVRLLKSSTVCPDFSVRTMRLKYSNTTSMVAEERTVCQVHYVAWPDHGVPSVVHPLLDMVRLVRDTQASETLPVLVHCSAGCGRTGTICAIDYVFGLLRTGKLTSEFSLSALIRDMRRQRIAMVQTKEQYVLVHQAVRELFREQLSVIDSHPYENVDPDGLLIIKSDQDNIYDTIDYQNKEEKSDFKMEKEAQSPLHPSGKKNFTLYSSKQEKEAENLTEQLRSVQGRPKTKMPSNSISLTSRSLVGHNSQIANKSSQKQGLTVKREINTCYNDKPIPSKGILRVPLLLGNSPGHSHSSGVPSGMVPVKRSKSLKIMPAHREKGLAPRLAVPPEPQTRLRPAQQQQQQQTFSPATTTSQQTANRSSSLELASYPEIANSSVNTQQGAVHPVKDEASSVTKKYEALRIGGKKLMRSYTTLDMRHKFLMPTPEGKTFKLQPVDPRLGLTCPIALSERVNLCDRQFGETTLATNIRQQQQQAANARTPYTVRNVPQPSLRLPARSYLLREKPSSASTSNTRNTIITSQNSHFHTTAPPEYHSAAAALHHKPMPKYHLAPPPPPSDSHQVHEHQAINHHRILVQKSIPPSLQNKHKDQPKIPWQHSADYKEGDPTKLYDVSPLPVEYLDKYVGLTSDLNQHQKHLVFDQRQPGPPAGIQQPLPGPAALGKSNGLYPPLPPRNQLALAPMTPRYSHLENSSFDTAPGVDIDQVAASIPSKDESKSNLMKVALEAFQMKKSKHQSRSDVPVPKGPPPSHGFTAGKKKQQQYL